jgi:hypothetical protein
MYLTIKQYKHNYKEDKTENTHACAHSQKTTTNKQTNKKTKTLHIKCIEHKLYITLNQYKKGNPKINQELETDVRKKDRQGQ